MRAVLDTNVIVSAYLSPERPPADLIRRWRTKAFILIVSTAILEEYGRILRRSHIRARHMLTDAEIDRQLAGLRGRATVVEPNEVLDVVAADPTDNRFFECAVAGAAEFVVSGDRHLLDVGQYRGIRVVTPAAFVAYLDSVGVESP